MKHYTCKCGKAEYFGSGMFPQDCEGCDDCGTNYNKEPKAEHEWITRYHSVTGKPYKMCRLCYQKGRGEGDGDTKK